MTVNPEPGYQKFGVLDIGSNSVRFVIYEVFGATFTAIYNEKILAGLGRDLRSTGKLSPNGKAEALAAIKRFKIISEAQKLDRILIGATAAMRMATDANAFIEDIKHATGLDISPISGKEEARLTALGLIAAQPRASGIAADLGGASLEIIHVDKGQVGQGVSFPLGPFRVGGHKISSDKSFDPVALRDRINKELGKEPGSLLTGRHLYLIGGAWRNLAGIHQERHLYPMRTLQAYTLMPGAAHDLAKWAYGSGRDDVLNWPGISQRRADTFPYAGLLLDVLLSRLDPEKVTISTTGLREGLVYDAMTPDQRSRDPLLDGCRDLAHGSLQGINMAEPLMVFLSPVNDLMPGAFDRENETRLRRAACHLVGVGKGLHPDYRAALVFEDVLYAPLAGLTHKERAYLAMILFHSYTFSTKDTPNASAIKLLLSLQERRAARIFGSAIRLGVVASGQSPELLGAFTLGHSKNTLTLRIHETYQGLATQRVGFRLRKLADLLEMSTKIG